MRVCNGLRSAVVMVTLAFVVMWAPSSFATGIEVVTAASGGESISVDTIGGTWTTLTGPVITETKARDTAGYGLGTIILTVPSGFEFNPNAPVSVLLEADGKKTINQMPDGSLLLVEVTSSTITLTITQVSRGGLAWPDRMTFQNIQVRPTIASPLPSGPITQSGTCEFRNLTLATGTWGSLQAIGGVPVGYTIIGSESGTAGQPLTITVQKVDQYGNPVAAGSTENLVFSGVGTIGDNAPTINGSSDAFTTGITVTFDENGTAQVVLVDYRAESTTVQVTDGYLSSTNVSGGLAMTIEPGTAAALVFNNPPVEVTYGSTIDLVVQTTDAYGNPSFNGLPASLELTLTLTNSSGTVVGTVTQDIGSAAGNGTANFELPANNVGVNTAVAGAEGLLVGTTVVTVNPVVLSPLVRVADKVYDGTVSATIASRKLEGIIGSDVVSLGESGSAVFETKDVGVEKPVMVTGLTLSGKDAGCYRLAATSLTTKANITPRTLNISIAAEPRNYDGTLAVTVSLSDDRLPGDHLTLSYASGSFSEAAAGSGKTIVVNGIALSGADAANYTFATSVTSAGTFEIRKAQLTVRADNQTRSLGAANPALTATMTGFVAGEDASVLGGALVLTTTAQFSSPAGDYPITPSGLSSSNYEMTYVPGTLTVTPVSVAGYDISGEGSGTAGDPVTIIIQKVDENGNPLPGGGTETLVFDGAGTIGTNAPTVNGSTDAFTNGIPVTFDENGTATVVLVDYRAETNTVQVTDGTLSSTNVDGGIVITVQPDTATSLVFTNPPVEVTYGGSYDLGLQTTDAYGNASTNGLPASLEVTVTVTNSSGAVVGTVTQDIGSETGNGTAVFEDLPAGAVGDNTATATADGLALGNTVISVNPAMLTPAVLVSDKVYDGTTAATIMSRNLQGVVGSDEVTLGDSGSAAFESKEVGTDKPVLVTGLSLVGKDAGAYQLVAASLITKANITPRVLAISGTAETKPYDGGVAATVSLTDNRVAGDNLTVSYSSAVFWESSAGDGKTVTVAGITISGPDAANYSNANSQTINVTGTILQVALTVSADNKTKIYGGENPVLTGTITGLMQRDNITATYSTAAQAASPAGAFSILPVLHDPDHKLGNYSLTQNPGTLTVLPASATVALASSENPALQGTNVVFTATVAAVAPATTTPSGAVLFLTNGVAAAGPAALSAGVANFSTGRLPLWNTVLTVAYLGDSNFLPATNTLSQLVRPPLEQPRIVSVVDNGDGTVTVTCHGTPAVEHYLQATATLDVPESWVTISTNVAGMWDGYWTYREPKVENQSRFYRAVKPY